MYLLKLWSTGCYVCVVIKYEHHFSEQFYMCVYSYIKFISSGDYTYLSFREEIRKPQQDGC